MPMPSWVAVMLRQVQRGPWLSMVRAQALSRAELPARSAWTTSGASAKF
jgi:hypothetical protein